jgi:hypothetical protein
LLKEERFAPLSISAEFFQELAHPDGSLPLLFRLKSEARRLQRTIDHEAVELGRHIDEYRMMRAKFDYIIKDRRSSNIKRRVWVIRTMDEYLGVADLPVGQKGAKTASAPAITNSQVEEGGTDFFNAGDGLSGIMPRTDRPTLESIDDLFGSLRMARLARARQVLAAEKLSGVAALFSKILFVQVVEKIMKMVPTYKIPWINRDTLLNFAKILRDISALTEHYSKIETLLPSYEVAHSADEIVQVLFEKNDDAFMVEFFRYPQTAPLREKVKEVAQRKADIYWNLSARLTAAEKKAIDLGPYTSFHPFEIAANPEAMAQYLFEHPDFELLVSFYRHPETAPYRSKVLEVAKAKKDTLWNLATDLEKAEAKAKELGPVSARYLRPAYKRWAIYLTILGGSGTYIYLNRKNMHQKFLLLEKRINTGTWDDKSGGTNAPAPQSGKPLSSLYRLETGPQGETQVEELAFLPLPTPLQKLVDQLPGSDEELEDLLETFDQVLEEASALAADGNADAQEIIQQTAQYRATFPI